MPAEQNPGLELSARGPAKTAPDPNDLHGASTGADAPTTWLDDHGDYLFAYACSHFADTHLAEDLVQETLLGAVQSHERFEHGSSVRTWLTSILRHKIVDHLRKTGRMGRARVAGTSSLPADEDADEEMLERFADSQFHRRGKWRILPGRWGRDTAEPWSAQEAEEFRRALLQCLEKLPPRPAEAIDLAERRGMTLEEISKILGVTATNAGVLLHRARLALRRCLELSWFRDP